MKQILRYSLLLLILIIAGCKDDDNPVIPGSGETIFTSSFETNGNPSFEGWQVLNSDTSLVKLVNDAPTGGGTYSVSIETVPSLPIQITKTAALAAGQNILTLKLFSKYEGIAGSFSIGIKDKLVNKTLDITDTGWKEYTLTDTVTAVQGDSIIVTLSGGRNQLLPGKTFYDLVSLKKN